MDLKKFALQYVEGLCERLTAIDQEKLEQLMLLIRDAIEKNRIIFVCGNGGSAAISSHFVCDYVKGIRVGNDTVVKMVCLNDNIPMITAISNDIGYEEVFAYQLSSLGGRGDLLIVVSSSGNSSNIVRVLEEAKRMGITTCALVGFSGGEARRLSNLAIHIDSSNYGIVEDSHHVIMHLITQYLARSENTEVPKE
ncbi:SIS domain-containing protein [Litoricolaceae bacterium]|nr:SIS domain-containing protein [Litorivicinaceae bacterium]